MSSEMREYKKETIVELKRIFMKELSTFWGANAE